MDDSSTNPSAPEPLTDGHRGGFSLWFVWAFLLLLLLYPLSTGPAIKLCLKHPAAGPALEPFYRPLSMLVQQNQTAHDLLWWYAEKVWKIPLSIPPPPAPTTNSPAPPGK